MYESHEIYRLSVHEARPHGRPGTERERADPGSSRVCGIILFFNPCTRVDTNTRSHTSPTHALFQTSRAASQKPRSSFARISGVIVQAGSVPCAGGFHVILS